MKIHLFDKQTYFYTGESEAVPGDVPDSWVYPGNATPTPPPADIPAGKGARWDGMAWNIVDAPTPAELRQAAYVAEADPLREIYHRYDDEANAWQGLEDTEEFDQAAIDEARTKAAEALVTYLTVKMEIRARYPDAVPVPGEEDDPEPPAEESVEAEPEDETEDA